MYRRLMCCYVIVLTLLDLSLNSKLTAQGKSHGVTVHDSLVEGITFQEWGAEAGAGGGRALPAGALRAEPPALAWGRAPLGAAHAATVTLTNTANSTMHLASIAGTTPDFHASFFDSKTLACGANTSFSVVFLGRREGPVAQHLYIHTSLGVLKYPVSAVGVASEWALWPLVGVRVPHNATLRPLLTMHNPTDHTVQVVEMYSSAAWLGLQLPGGGASAPRAHWQLPPRSSRALARLRLRAAPAARAEPDTRAAYIRIKANVTGPPLVVVVEAAAAAAGAHADPLQLRAGTRGAQDAPYTFSISLGNSAGAAVEVAGGAWGACRAAPHCPAPPPAPPAHANGAPHTHTHNGAGADGVQLSPLRTRLPPHQEPAPGAQLTLDFGKLWASGAEEAEEAEEASAERWCAGWAALAGGALPYSVRLLPGTLRVPPELQFVTADEEGCLRAQEVRVRNEFAQPVKIVSVEFPPEIREHFHTEAWAGLELAAGGEGAAARLRLRQRDVRARLDAALTLRTNLTHSAYAVPVRLYHGSLIIEWDWPNATATELDLGLLGTSSTRRVRASVHNPAPLALCAGAGSTLAGATLELQAPAGCVPAGGRAAALLTVVAPARAGAAAGGVWLQAPAAGGVWLQAQAPAPAAPPRARAATAVRLRALPGAVRARLLHAATPAPAPAHDDHAHAAPWASGWAPELVVESTLAARMRLLRVEAQPPDPALLFVPAEDAEAGWISPGTQSLGTVRYLPERACGGACYTGRGEGEREAEAGLRAPLEEELALLARRRALYRAEMLRAVRNVSLVIDTTEMVRIPVSGWVRMGWPRLARDAGWLGLAGVGAGGGRWLRVRNPSPHPLLLRAHVGPELQLPPDTLVGVEECAREACTADARVFSVAEWRAARGAVAPLPGAGGEGEGEEGGGPALLLAPHAELELRLACRPVAPVKYSAVLYLRNNLTIVEALQLGAQGAVPSFELAGRAARADAHAHKPILLQIADCGEGQECAEGEAESRWEVRRTIVARNTGAVPLRLRGWRLAGEPCRARGFSLEPCAPLALAPNESRALTLAFRADCSLARVACPLTLRADSGAAAFRLVGAVPARLLPACAAAAPRAPAEPALRAAGSLLAVLALALVLAAAALDAERLLRRARDARAQPAPRARLDLRALALGPAPAPAPAPAAAPAPASAPRRRRPARRARAAPDPKLERRAFELWRAEMLRRDAPRADDDESRSSEEAEAEVEAEAEAEAPPPAPEPSDAEDAAPVGSSGSESGASGSESPAEEEAPQPRASPAPVRAGPRDAAGAGGAEGGRAARARREPRAPSPAARADPPARPRAAIGKHHTRKDKVSKRRGERSGAAAAGGAPASAARLSPGGGGGGVAGGGGGGEARAGSAGAAPAPPLRWGASWSSVVAAGAPPPPPAPAPAPSTPPAPAPAASPSLAARAAPDQSLFYFNDAPHLPPPEPEYAWRAPDRSPFDAPAPAPAPVYRVPEESAGGHGNAYGTIGSPWSGAGLWGALRPPPGFGPRPAPAPAPAAPAPAAPAPPAHPAPPVRPYDPFHSLASIWAPAAFDWGAEPRERDRDAR